MATPKRTISRVLVAEDNPGLQVALARLARRWADDVAIAGTVAEALEQLYPPLGLVILDVRFPDGSGLEVVDAARKLVPIPAIVAISGQATPEEAFALARSGVRAYVRKPVTPEDLTDQVESALRSVPDLDPFVAASVGQLPLKEVQSHVREIMFDHALALSDGNRSGTARMLGLTRQAVQQILHSRDREESEPSECPTPEVETTNPATERLQSRRES